MKFKPITPDDNRLLRDGFAKLKTVTCNLTAGTMIMWRQSMRAECAAEDGALFCRMDPDGRGYRYFLPAADDMERALKTLEAYVSAEGETLCFCAVPEEYLPLLQAVLDLDEITEEADSFDYVYLAEDLSSFSGKRYSGQRNHINQFLRGCDTWEFTTLDSGNVGRVTEFFLRAYPDTADEPYFKRVENALVLDILKNFDRCDMFGGVLSADGEVVGFAMGETVRDTLLTHVEKADRNRHGAFQMLVREFTSYYSAGGIKYVNREDDMGDPGLRAAKRALHPAELRRKFRVTVKGRAM